MNFFSPSANAGRGAFFNADIYGAAMPADAVKVTALLYRKLMEGQAAGREIIVGEGGLPKLGPVKRPGVEDLRAQAIKATKAVARRRILAVASLERQANDNAAIAMRGLAPPNEQPSPEAFAEITAAIARRRKIDAIRTASNAIEAVIARMPAANLTHFDAAAAPQWPAQE